MQGPLSTTFPIENRNTHAAMTALKSHLDRTKSLPFVKRISDFHLLLFLAQSHGLGSDVPALAECVDSQTAVPEGYQLLIESMASTSWCYLDASLLMGCTVYLWFILNDFVPLLTRLTSNLSFQFLPWYRGPSSLTVLPSSLQLRALDSSWKVIHWSYFYFYAEVGWVGLMIRSS